MRLRFILIYLTVVASGTAVHASGEDAWAAFRIEVAQVCLALPDAPAAAAIVVSPFGSESYGTALISSVTDGVLEQRVCIFRKSDHTAELAAPFPAAPPAP